LTREGLKATRKKVEDREIKQKKEDEGMIRKKSDKG
jgi:hypothetical protein